MQAKDTHLIISSETFTCTLENVKLMRNWLEKQAVKIGLSIDTIENLKLVVSELITNCVKHQPAGTSTIFLQFMKKENRYMFALLDDGAPFDDYEKLKKGIDKEDIFDIRESGMGLGIIQALFPEQNYTPKRNIEDPYNSFSFYLTDEITHLSRPVIVIVDDDATIQSILLAYLQDNYQIAPFDNANLAIDFLLQNHVDLVISDINMPDIDGFGFRNALSKYSNTDTIPFIFLTAEETIDSQDQAAELGVDDYLVKPVKKNQLLAVIKRVLTRSEWLKQRIGERLDTAITNSLKPIVPQNIGRTATALETRSASAGGGDFVFHSQHEDFDMLVIGDIMGHGEQAKFFAHAHMGYFHGLMRATEMGSSPAFCLKKLSNAIDSSPVLEATMVTCLAIRLDHNGVVTIACAGHPPPLLLENSHLSELPVSGALPGLMPNQQYMETKIKLNNKRLFLYTDGLFEAVEGSGGRDSLEEKLKLLMNQTADLSLEDALNTIMGRFDQITKGKPLDDVTLLILQSGR